MPKVLAVRPKTEKPGELALTGLTIRLIQLGLGGSAGFGSVAGIEAVSGGFVPVEFAPVELVPVELAFVGLLVSVP
jgi:hypothetical protein